MSTSRLRARLDRLATSVTATLGRDRDRDRRRRDELRYRKLSPAGLSQVEDVELAMLQALFEDEDRDRGRLLELLLQQFSAEHLRREPLTDIETRELAELEARFPPDPNDPLADAIEEYRRAAIREHIVEIHGEVAAEWATGATKQSGHFTELLTVAELAQTSSIGKRIGMRVSHPHRTTAAQMQRPPGNLF